jgi:hypothetical protein
MPVVPLMPLLAAAEYVHFLQMDAGHFKIDYHYLRTRLGMNYVTRKLKFSKSGIASHEADDRPFSTVGFRLSA